MTFDSAKGRALAARLAGRLAYNVPLAALTSYGVGGPARALARPDTEEELAALLAFCRENGWPHFILGGGTNVLFADEGYDGLVVQLGPGFGAAAAGADETLRAGAGALSARVLALALRLGLGGLEMLTGLPGAIGGAARMNAGAGGEGLGGRVETLTCLTGAGEVRHLPKESLTFEYRRLTGLPEDAVITGVTFKLVRTPENELKARVRELTERRRLTQPQGVCSAGCVFKNPAGEPAGRLIDRCGLKGAAAGGARISEKHANFIVNEGGASRADIVTLMKLAREAVFRRHGLTLEPEITLVEADGRVGVL